MECLQEKQDGGKKKKKAASEESEDGEEEEEEASEEEEEEEEKKPAKRGPTKKTPSSKRKKGSSDDEESASDDDASDEEYSPKKPKATPKKSTIQNSREKCIDNIDIILNYILVFFLQISLERRARRREVIATVTKTGEKIKKLQEPQQRRVAPKAREVVIHVLSHCHQNLPRLSALNRWLDMKS